jgi:hypothetical protein
MDKEVLERVEQEKHESGKQHSIQISSKGIEKAFAA